ncbi:MAG: phenylalanyl-tRNA synthetase beta chain, partial [Rickettsiales bacterium]
MKFTLSCLKKYLETTVPVSEICYKLNNIGLEVEEVFDESAKLAPFSVAQIVSASPHPDSTKLQICQVDTGIEKNIQIVCGAKNARTGLKVAYAPIGSTIPNGGMVIKKAKIAGVESSGMLCSASEIGLGKDGDGIMEIDEKIAVGTKINQIFTEGETIVEISVTPNRGDCLGVFGIARDLAASGIGTLKFPEIKEINGSFESEIKAEINSKNCEYFSGIQIKNIKNAPSPKWLKDYLESVGSNSISAIVDITNYAMLQLNQPMHAYDSDRLSGNIIVRDALEGENFKSLKDLDYVLSGGELIIENDQNIIGLDIIGLAGIIGGKDSSVLESTTNIFLEAAFFNAENIATTGRNLNIISDARYRFERAIDLANVKNALKFAANLILEICGGEPSKIVEVGNNKPKKTEINFDLSQIKQLIGIEIPEDFVIKTLQDLGFEVQKISENILKVQVPTHRKDISIYQDLIEEIIRFYGLDNIKSEAILVDDIKTQKSALDIARFELSNAGFNETINYSFIDKKSASLFAELKPELQLLNPISSQMSQMRPSLLAGILQNISKNQMRSFADLSLFEIGRIFSGSGLNEQKNSVAAVRIGKNKVANHYLDQRDFDVFDLKKDLFDLLETFGFSSQSFGLEDGAPDYYHPHRSKKVKLGRNIVGYFGEIHPLITKKFDVKGRAIALEIFIEELPINLDKKINKK